MLAFLTRRQNDATTTPAVDQPTQNQDTTTTQPPRPEDLQTRYSTVGGSYTDVTGTWSMYDDKFRWNCHGCKERSRFPDTDGLSSMRQRANDHANACRAIPL